MPATLKAPRDQVQRGIIGTDLAIARLRIGRARRELAAIRSRMAVPSVPSSAIRSRIAVAGTKELGQIQHPQLSTFEQRRIEPVGQLDDQDQLGLNAEDGAAEVMSPDRTNGVVADRSCVLGAVARVIRDRLASTLSGY